MVHAVIMIRTDSGTAESVRDAVSALGSVADAHVVAGDFDVIAELDETEVYDVLDTASSSIQDTDGVQETKTYVSLT
ncbi:Lrp/AsnC ligand binding domain-containing protein [Halanaeroarchaeum sp. HSR-CO]|uniref:Lrp/AsnC ligand binding domain-containing protein n=1 Tax=Halanaeroarchaeum sp. HSR-CO TaxID=2866382 RepID=UPI00217CE0F4|nr:Lrp/AsnC ligand binding domain-containing protein [Halanaeroarchaeum sp. HSR-CO]